MAYRWIKRNYKLTKDQKERGVIFSSQIINHTFGDTDEALTHEVFADQPDKYEVIENLKDVSFFRNMARDFGYDCEVIERS